MSAWWAIRLALWLVVAVGASVNEWPRIGPVVLVPWMAVAVLFAAAYIAQRRRQRKR